MKNRYYGIIRVSLPFKNINENEIIKTKKNKGKTFFVKAVLTAFHNLTNQFSEDKELEEFIAKGHNEGQAQTIISYEGDFPGECMAWINLYTSFLCNYSDKKLKEFISYMKREKIKNEA